MYRIKVLMDSNDVDKRRKYRLMNRKKKIWISVGAIMLLIAITGALFTWEQYYRMNVCNFSSYDEESHGYYVFPGASIDSVLEIVLQDYKIAAKTDFKWHKKRLLFNSVKPGYYRFPAKMGNREFMTKLQLGQQTPIRLTFNNQIRTREQLAGRLAKQLLLDSVSIIERLDSTGYMQQYGLNRETAVCMFLPDTYEIYWTTTPDKLFDRMYKEYQRFWNVGRLHKADSLGLKPTEVATLASIVESETHRQAEFPTIASLYLNRLRLGMPLQACPTVIFAVGDFKMRRVLKRHLRIESPYNTYINRGLPPGPIRCARGSTIDSVLCAPKTDYLFMCANPDWSGTHLFSSSYGKHAAAAKEYQKELNARQIH